MHTKTLNRDFFGNSLDGMGRSAILFTQRLKNTCSRIKFDGSDWKQETIIFIDSYGCLLDKKTQRTVVVCTTDWSLIGIKQFPYFTHQL